jgi:hypothetical protein
MIKKLAVAATQAAKRIRIEDGQETASKEDVEDDKDDVPFDREALEAEKAKYESFWNQFGKALKLGVSRGSTRCLHGRLRCTHGHGGDIQIIM